MTKNAQTPEEHRQHHVALHRAFDELLADFLRHWYAENRDPLCFIFKGPSNTTTLELMEWSHQQTIEPDEYPE